jgi:hypothetical protein
MATVFRMLVTLGNQGGHAEVKEPPDREPLQAVRMGMSSRYSMEEIAEAVGRVRSVVGGEWTRSAVRVE